MPNTNNPNTPPTPGGQPPSPADALREHLAKAYERRARATDFFPGQRPFAVADGGGKDKRTWWVSTDVVEAEPPRLRLVLHSVPVNNTLGLNVGSGPVRVAHQLLEPAIRPIVEVVADRLSRWEVVRQRSSSLSIRYRRHKKIEWEREQQYLRRLTVRVNAGNLFNHFVTKAQDIAARIVRPDQPLAA